MRFKVPMVQDHIFHLIEYYPSNTYNLVNLQKILYINIKKKIGEESNHPAK